MDESRPKRHGRCPAAIEEELEEREHEPLDSRREGRARPWRRIVAVKLDEHKAAVEGGRKAIPVRLACTAAA